MTCCLGTVAVAAVSIGVALIAASALIAITAATIIVSSFLVALASCRDAVVCSLVGLIACASVRAVLVFLRSCCSFWRRACLVCWRSSFLCWRACLVKSHVPAYLLACLLFFCIIYYTSFEQFVVAHVYRLCGEVGVPVEVLMFLCLLLCHFSS